MPPAWYGKDDGKSKFESCAEDDPERCQSVIKTGQCHYKSVPGTPYCARHGGTRIQQIQNKESVSNYKLMAFKERLDELRGSEGIKSLRDEISIARMVVEAILNKCKDAGELLMYHSQINQSTITLEKLVKSCQMLEERNNYLLDKDQLYIIVDSISKIIGEFVTDPDILNQIGDKIYDTIANAASRSAKGEFAT